MTAALAVFFGAGLGGVCRHGVNLAVARWLGTGFPFGTLAANLLGGLLMGLLVESLARGFEPAPTLRLFLATGVLGGFTTFSAFSLDVVLLIERGEMGLALLYGLISVAGAVGGVWAGMGLIRLLVRALAG